MTSRRDTRQVKDMCCEPALKRLGRSQQSENRPGKDPPINPRPKRCHLRKHNRIEQATITPEQRCKAQQCALPPRPSSTSVSFDSIRRSHAKLYRRVITENRDHLPPPLYSNRGRCSTSPSGTGSVSPPALIHAFIPPRITLVEQFSFSSIRATRTLVASCAHEQ